MSARAVSALALALVIPQVLSPGVLSAAHPERRQVRRTVPAKDGLVVELTNLAGRVTIEGSKTGEVEVLGELFVEGKGDAETQRLLAGFDVAFEARGDRYVVHARYPLGETRTIAYPRGDGHDDIGFFDFLSFSRDHVKYDGERVAVTTSRRSRAPIVYADFRIRVPQGVGVDVRNSVGLVEGGDVKGPTSVLCDSGDVRLRTITGALHAKSGSGDLTIADVEGESTVETGSGDVSLERANGASALSTGSGDILMRHVRGDVKVSTGSGDVTLADVEAKRVVASTGSGNVVLERVTGSLELETGSGDIRGDRLGSAERLHAETGSGNLVVRGDLSGVRDVSLGSSSGDVRVSLDRPVPMHLQASTSSGDITVELPNMKTVKKGDHELEADVDGGGAAFRIRTSSGNVHVASR